MDQSTDYSTDQTNRVYDHTDGSPAPGITRLRTRTFLSPDDCCKLREVPRKSRPAGLLCSPTSGMMPTWIPRNFKPMEPALDLFRTSIWTIGLPERSTWSLGPLTTAIALEVLVLEVQVSRLGWWGDCEQVTMPLNGCEMREHTDNQES